MVPSEVVDVVICRLCQTAAVDLTVQIAGDVARRRETSYDVPRLLLMVPLEPSVRQKMTILGPL